MQQQIDVNPLEITSPKMDDKRRTIREYNGVDYAAQLFKFKSSDSVGNHFHKMKWEYFIVFEGRGVFRGYPVDEQGRAIGEVITTWLVAPCVIVVHPYTAHVFNFDRGSRMTCHSTAPFDPLDLNAVEPF